MVEADKLLAAINLLLLLLDLVLIWPVQLSFGDDGSCGDEELSDKFVGLTMSFMENRHIFGMKKFLNDRFAIDVAKRKCGLWLRSVVLVPHKNEFAKSKSLYRYQLLYHVKLVVLLIIKKYIL